MAEHPITLTVSDYVYKRAQQIAEATAQPIEEVLEQRLEAAFTKLPISMPSSDNEVVHVEPLSGPEIVESGLLGSWADMGIEDSSEWVEEQRRKRSDENKW